MLKEDTGASVIDVLVPDPSLEVALGLPNGDSVTSQSASAKGLEWRSTDDPRTERTEVAGLLFPQAGRHQLIYFKRVPRGAYTIRALGGTGEFRALFLPYEVGWERYAKELNSRQPEPGSLHRTVPAAGQTTSGVSFREERQIPEIIVDTHPAPATMERPVERPVPPSPPGPKPAQAACRISLLSTTAGRVGRIIVSARIDEDGRAREVKVVQSNNPALNHDAIEYVEQCGRYQPGDLAGIPGNGKPFPDGAKMAKIHWNPKKMETFPAATVPGSKERP